MPLKIVIPKSELWDSKNNRFLYTDEHTIVLEHSLVSISKWESKWHKPFLSRDKKTKEEMKDYVRCMTLTQNVDPSVYDFLSNKNLEEIRDYLDDSMTATWIKDTKHQPGSNRIVTSELIYYWMIALSIPFECQKWHINRLMMLIRVCNEENKPKKKLGRKSTYSRNSALNAARRAKAHSSG